MSPIASSSGREKTRVAASSTISWAKPLLPPGSSGASPYGEPVAP
ncbi:MAG TPA: hypothetical protein VN033_00770 [Vulgatibacter sp.]|nr:hypothetical protein [Vulgatibacter sp.]